MWPTAVSRSHANQRCCPVSAAPRNSPSGRPARPGICRRPGGSAQPALRGGVGEARLDQGQVLALKRPQLQAAHAVMTGRVPSRPAARRNELRALAHLRAGHLAPTTGAACPGEEPEEPRGLLRQVVAGQQRLRDPATIATPLLQVASMASATPPGCVTRTHPVTGLGTIRPACTECRTPRWGRPVVCCPAPGSAGPPNTGIDIWTAPY